MCFFCNGHGRVLAPDMRSIKDAYLCSRILLIKAARRMRRDGYYAREDKGVGHKVSIYSANDDQAAISALGQLWRELKPRLPSYAKIIRIGLFFGGLIPADMRQLDLLQNDDQTRQGWERILSQFSIIQTVLEKLVCFSSLTGPNL